MVLWYAAGIRDLAEMNKHLIEQLIVGRKHKKVQARLLEKGKVLSLVEAIDVGTRSLSQLEKLGGIRNDSQVGKNWSTTISKQSYSAKQL